MSKLKVAAIQMHCAATVKDNLRHAEELVRKAASKEAKLILLPELWERPYFCQERRYDFYQYALPVEENPAVAMGKRLAKELNIVLPIILLPALMLVARFWACTARHIFLMIIFIRKNFILNLVTVALLCLTRNMGV